MAARSAQKRRPGRPGKRGRKSSTMTEVIPDDSQETDMTWWRGGMLSVLLHQKGSLPWSLVKKAARKGGSRKVDGIYYNEGSDAGKRSRRLVWRAAVDMSRTVSQFALQVRYLDLHIRWSDLLHLDNNVPDTKVAETEASVFRNAYICDKKVMDNEIRYSIVFEKQKHLPSRVLKSIIEVEQSQSETPKYWFPETRIPLYLIKKFEQRACEVPSSDKHVSLKPKSHRRSLKSSMADIVIYLTRKRDNVEQQYCVFCNLDIFLSDEDNVKCSACEGLCHKQCTSSSLVFFDDGAEYVSTCKTCCNAQTHSRSINCNDSPTSPLLLQGQNRQNKIAPKEKPEIMAASDQSLASSVDDKHPSPYESKPSVSSKSSAPPPPRGNRSWGLIWIKKSEDDGTEFRIKNILLKGETIVDSSDPACYLCKHPYNSDLMYIRCEACMFWYHAEAVELEESKIFKLAGFKCCKCRRIRSPICPYDESKKNRPVEIRTRNNGPKKPEGSNKMPEKKIRIIGPKPEGSDYKPNISLLKSQNNSHNNNNNNSVLIGRENRVNAGVDDDSHHHHLTGPTPQKLPIRRQNNNNNTLSNDLEWGVDDAFNYEDMEFEPQTYLSINELITPNDDSNPHQPLHPPTPSNGAVEEDTCLSMFPNYCVTDKFNGIDDLTFPSLSCKICYREEPYPDLFCQFCEIWIHSHCSPWEEDDVVAGSCDSWSCGECRTSKR